MVVVATQFEIYNRFPASDYYWHVIKILLRRSFTPATESVITDYVTGYVVITIYMQSGTGQDRMGQSHILKYGTNRMRLAGQKRVVE